MKSSLLRFAAMGLVLACAFALAGSASANVLINPGFEDPGVVSPPPEYYGAGNGWTSFGGGIYTVDSTVNTPNTGNQSLKMFGGCCSGAFQQFPTVPGTVWNGGVWIKNSSLDPMGGGQVAAVNIEWIQADGVTQSTIIPFISNGTFDATKPQDVWTLQTITGAAPADAAYARFVVITGDFLPGGPAGAPFYDDAFFEEQPVPVEPTTWGTLKSLYR